MSNTLKYVILAVFIIIAVTFVLVWAGVIPGLRLNKAKIQRADITMWGVDDDKNINQKLINAYLANNPGIKIAYQQKSKETYEDELIRAFAAGKGPDIFGIHRTWRPKYSDILSSAPKDIFLIADFRNTFLEIVQKDFIINNEIYGVPLYVDTLALYYNTEWFHSAGIVLPPKDWDEFVEIARRLTKRKSNGDILFSGAALGAADNVADSADILALLFAQNGVRLSDENGNINFNLVSDIPSGARSAEKALEFYTSFAKPQSGNYSWSKDSAINSEEAFAQNRAAMALGYSATSKKLLSKNARAKFEIAALPQVKNAVFHKNYPEYWGFGVYKNSKNKDAAWQFLKFLAQPDISRYYLSATKKPAAQKSLVVEQQNDPRLGVFATQGLTAFFWTQLDEAIIKRVFREMIEAQLTSDQSPTLTIKSAEAKIKSLMKK